MSVTPPAVGIDHPTVVPTNFDGGDGAESDADVSADDPVSPESGSRDEP